MSTLASEKEAQFTPNRPPDERRELVRRIVASSTFAKSPRLSSFFSYICDLTIQGRADEINEQQIGAAVFGRKPHYDSSVDGIVRAQASRLRNRLELYFEDEGLSETTRIVIPRGGYVPRFISHGTRAVSHADPTSIPSSPEPSEDQSLDPTQQPIGAIPPSKPRQLWIVPLFLVAVALVLAVPVLLRTFHRPDSQAFAATSNPLWQQLLVKDRPTLLIYGDSGLVMYQAAVSHSIDLSQYLSGGYRDQVIDKAGAPPLELSDLSTRRYTTVVDLEIIRDFDRAAERRGANIDAQYARDVRPNDLKQGNSILIGAPEANPWVELFERNMHFAYTYDRAHHVHSVINKSPQGSEPKQWDSAAADKENRVYGVVAYLPNLSGTGNTLILEGTGMSATEAAWDFVSDDSQLSPFLNKIRRPDHSLPHFEVVLGTNNMRGSAVKTAILAWRTQN